MLKYMVLIEAIMKNANIEGHEIVVFREQKMEPVISQN